MLARLPGWSSDNDIFFPTTPKKPQLCIDIIRLYGIDIISCRDTRTLTHVF
jgi:hypothetical protein